MMARTPTTPTAPAQPVSPPELEDFIRLPGLFHGWELKPVVMSSPNFRMEEAGRGANGEPLFAVYARAIDARRREPLANAQRALHGNQVVEPADADELYGGLIDGTEGTDDADDADRTDDADRADDARSLGELKARHREEHLCFRCAHHHVCGTATGLDPALLVTICSCLAFRPTEPEETYELMPIEPVPMQ